MKQFLSILICISLLSLSAFATTTKKSSKKQVKKVEAKKNEIPDIHEFQVVEDFTKFSDYVDEIRYCNVSRGIHIQFLVIAPHKTLFFVCGSLDAIKKTKTEYIPNIEDPYTIHWLPAPRRKIHFDEMGGFGGEKSDIEVFKDKILIHVSILWNKKESPLYTRTITCDDKTCNYKKFTCDFNAKKADEKLIPEFNQFLDTINDPKNKKSETWNDLWGIYMGKILFQALSNNDVAKSFIRQYPQKSVYPSDGFFAETQMTIKDDLDLAKTVGCVQ